MNKQETIALINKLSNDAAYGRGADLQGYQDLKNELSRLYDEMGQSAKAATLKSQDCWGNIQYLTIKGESVQMSSKSGINLALSNAIISRTTGSAEAKMNIIKKAAKPAELIRYLSIITGREWTIVG